MTALLRWILGIVITVAAVLFALANRQSVDVTWSPLHPSVALPVFALAMGGVVIGFVAGGIAVWLNESAVRRDRRKQRKLIRRLEEQLQSSNENKSESRRFLLLPGRKKAFTTNSHE